MTAPKPSEERVRLVVELNLRPRTAPGMDITPEMHRQFLEDLVARRMSAHDPITVAVASTQNLT